MPIPAAFLPPAFVNSTVGVDHGAESFRVVGTFLLDEALVDASSRFEVLEEYLLFQIHRVEFCFVRKEYLYVPTVLTRGGLREEFGLQCSFLFRNGLLSIFHSESSLDPD